jgi:DNA gyrase/topoisomerase IV subunit A
VGSSYSGGYLNFIAWFKKTALQKTYGINCLLGGNKTPQNATRLAIAVNFLMA